MDVTPAELRDYVCYQTGAVREFCRAAGADLQHVKPRHPLHDGRVAGGDRGGHRAGGAGLGGGLILTLASASTTRTAGRWASASRPRVRRPRLRGGRHAGLPAEAGALITDPEKAAAQAVRMASEGKVRTIDGVDIDISVQTICCHEDTREPSDRARGARGPRRGGDPRPAARVARLEWPARGRTRSRPSTATAPSSIGRAASPPIMRAAWADGVRLERGAIIRAYMAAEREVEAGGYRSYQESPAESARASRRASAGASIPPARRSLPSVPSWVAFPDTNAALERLHAAGYALGILSNIDDDLLTATRASLHHDLRAHRHRAAGARLQARAPALRGRPPRGRRSCVASRRPGVFSRHGARGRRAFRTRGSTATATLPTTGGGPTGSFPRCGAGGLAGPAHGDFRRDADLRPASPRAGRGRAEHRAMIDIPARLLGIG